MLMGLAIVGAGYFARKAWKQRESGYVVASLACVAAGILIQVVGGEILTNAMNSAFNH